MVSFNTFYIRAHSMHTFYCDRKFRQETKWEKEREDGISKVPQGLNLWTPARCPMLLAPT